MPVLTFLGNLAVANQRANATDWRHSAQDPAAMVRDFTKWDDQPLSLQHFAESVVRGAKLALTPPMAPVALVAKQPDLGTAILLAATGLSVMVLAGLVILDPVRNVRELCIRQLHAVRCVVLQPLFDRGVRCISCGIFIKLVAQFTLIQTIIHC